MATPFLIGVLPDSRELELHTIRGGTTISKGRTSVRWLAFDALEAVGDKTAISPLINVLQNPECDSITASRVINVLTRFRDPRISEAILAYMNNWMKGKSAYRGSLALQSEGVIEAAVALGNIGDQHAVEPLIGILKMTSPLKSPSRAAIMNALIKLQANKSLVNALNATSYNASYWMPFEGGTPLHEAAYFGYDDIARILLTSGAKVNAKDKSGNTPLHYAILRQNQNVADLLRQHGGQE